jgi:hypothetical protein
MDLMAKDIQMTLNYQAELLLFDLAHELWPTMLKVLGSDLPIPIRTESAVILNGIHTYEAAKLAGEVLLQQDDSQEHEKLVFRRFLVEILSRSYQHIAVSYAKKAFDKKILTASNATQIIGKTGTENDVPLLLQIADATPEKNLYQVLVNLRILSPGSALEFAKRHAMSTNESLSFEVLRTFAEDETDVQAKELAVQKLIDLFPKVDEFKQAKIAESLGNSQCESARLGLVKYSTRAIEKWALDAVQKALAKYKRK